MDIITFIAWIALLRLVWEALSRIQQVEFKLTYVPTWGEIEERLREDGEPGAPSSQQPPIGTALVSAEGPKSVSPSL